jgi:AcrR family transcriptional regulator
VPYRPTERTRARLAAARERIVDAALDQLAEGGYASASVAGVARRAGVATGTVYRHFPSKGELFAEVFRRASQREVDVLVSMTDLHEPVSHRLAAWVEAFVRRALAEPVRAYALIAEPVDPAVEAERLVFRRAYRDALAVVIEAGIAAGDLPDQDAATSAAALVGAIAEAMVGPLSPTAGPHDPGALVGALRDFCIRSVTGKEPVRVAA